MQQTSHLNLCHLDNERASLHHQYNKLETPVGGGGDFRLFSTIRGDLDTQHSLQHNNFNRVD